MEEPTEDRPRLIPAEDIARRFGIEERRMTLEAGLLGKIFGSARNAPTSIAGIIVLLFTLTSIAVLFLPANVPASDYLKTVFPIISLMVGYLFGKST